MNRTELANLRREFASEELSEAAVASDPFAQFGLWMDEALRSEVVDANAMTLATVGEDNKPSARVVLLKYFGHEGFAFFTNYESKKGRDLAGNPYASLHFYWPQLNRQVAINGRAEKTTREDSFEYFNSRPVESRLGAWASNQSRVIESRQILEDRVEEFRQKFGDNVPLPDFWGGYRIIPNRFEFWQGRESRLHDRIVYELAGEAWSIVRLSP